MMSPQRLGALIWKEILQISRDPSSILIAFLLPLILLFIFGYGVSLDTRNVPVGLVVMEQSAEAGSFAASLDGSPYLDLKTGRTYRELEPRLIAGELRGIVVLRENFARHLQQPGTRAPIQVLTDGSNPNQAAFVEAYVRGAWSRWQEAQAEAQGQSIVRPIVIEPRFWYNPEVNSSHFLIPGSIAIILTVVGALLTALVIAREWERGTMEAMLASPITRAELLLGKVIPYYGLGLLSFSICLAATVWLFEVPFRGSLPALYAITSLFLFGALGLGLTISAVTKNQFLASQAAINAAFLPSLMLSGFIFEIRSMPEWIQAITYVFPARYYVGSLQTLFLAGDNWTILLPKAGALLIVAIVFLVAIARNLKRTLD
jgi:ABC-2 type transport system permease protein